MSSTVRVWDLPTRVFHWTLAAFVTVSIITGYVGGSAMPWHFRSGYAIFTLLLFRIVWGLVGGRWSRFTSFLYSPATLVRYLKGQGQPQHSVGHTPLGAGSVFLLLVFLCAQVGTGLFSDDEIAFAGPLTGLVSNATVSQATRYHSVIGQRVVIALVLLHVAAVLFYLLKRGQNLIRPMIDGDKQLAMSMPGSRDDARSRLAAAGVLLACAGLVNWVVNLGA